MLVWGSKRRPQAARPDRREAPREAAVSPDAFLAALVADGRIEAPAADRARAALAGGAASLAFVMTELGLIAEADLVAALSAFTGLTPAAEEDLPAEAVLREALPAAFCRRMRILPLGEGAEGGPARIGIVDPLDEEGRTAIAYGLDGGAEFRVLGASVFEAGLRRLYEEGEGEGDALPGADGLDGDMDRLEDVARQAPIIRLANQLFRTAFEAGATDIHIEPGEAELRVRYRVDGQLVRPQVLPKSAHTGLSTRLKILAGLNIAERRLPQDGRIALTDRGREVDVRVSVLPTPNGEGLVLRLLGRREGLQGFPSLGFAAPQIRTIEAMVRRPNGLFLVTGPTGSGKTTTLYTALGTINDTARKIITVEDPVEYRVSGVTQVQTHAAIGLDFAGALRSILRQDPDVVMIGEIRDGETAKIAVQASLTGHLVLSTLHTNSAAATVTRLTDMGLPPYLVAAVLNGVLAQRLVRLLCQECRTTRLASTEERLVLERARPALRALPIEVARPCGCKACAGTGFRGRAVVAELLPLDRTVRGMIADRASEDEVEAAARAGGMTSLGEAGLARVLAGETSLDEMLRHLDIDAALPPAEPSRRGAAA